MPIHRKFCVVLPLLAVLLTTGIDAAYAIGPRDSRNGDECRAQVNARYAALEARMRAQGNYRGIAVVEDEWREPGLLACRAMDRMLRDEQMSASLRRLSSAIDRLRAGQVLSRTLMQQLDANHAAIGKMPTSPYREAYLRQYADYLRYLSAMPSAAATSVRSGAIYRCGSPSKRVIYTDQPCTANVPQQTLSEPAAPENLAGENCTTLRKQLADSHRAYAVANDALLASANQPGNGWRNSEAQSQKAVSDLRWYTNLGQRLGCHVR